MICQPFCRLQHLLFMLLPTLKITAREIRSPAGVFSSCRVSLLFETVSGSCIILSDRAAISAGGV